MLLSLNTTRLIISYHCIITIIIMLLAWISLTLSRHFSLSFIASCRSSGLHPVSSHSCWMYDRAGRPAFSRPYVGVHRSRSLMSSSLLLQQCPASLAHLTWIVFVMGGRWPYSWCFVGCCCQDLLISFIYLLLLIISLHRVQDHLWKMTIKWNFEGDKNAIITCV